MKLLLEHNKANAIVAADSTSHNYEDKYLVAEQVVNCLGASIWNTLISLGLTTAMYEKLYRWSKLSTVSLRLSRKETCRFVREATREEESSTRSEMEVTGFLGTKITSKTVTKIKEFFYEFEAQYELSAFRGVGEHAAEDFVLIRSRQMSQECVLRSKSQPYPEVATDQYDVNISWLLHHTAANSLDMCFNIDRSNEDCHTPTRNVDISVAESFVTALHEWGSAVDHHVSTRLREVRETYGKRGQIDMSRTSIEEVLSPVFPLFRNTEDELISAEEPLLLGGSEGLTASSDSCLTVSAGGGAGDAALVRSWGSGSAAAMKSVDVSLLLREQVRSLTSKMRSMEELYPAATSRGELVSAGEAQISVGARYLQEVCRGFWDSMAFLEEMLRKQLISAIGKESVSYTHLTLPTNREV